MITYLTGFPETISVNEELPPENCTVIIYGKYNCSNADLPNDMNKEEAEGIFYDFAYRNDNKWHLEKYDQLLDYLEIQYWSPLPNILE